MTAQLSGSGEDLTGKVCAARIVGSGRMSAWFCMHATARHTSLPYFTPCACALEKGAHGESMSTLLHACETTTVLVAIYTPVLVAIYTLS